MLNFEINQLNSPFDDTAFFIRNTYHRRAMLLDCGRLGALSHSEILSLSDIFISHTHMDHFFGFDRILRGSIISNETLRVYGPPGFINNVDGKFRGYTWNLAEDYNFKVKAFELHPDGKHKVGLFDATNRFIPEISELECDYFDLDDGLTMQYEFFEHLIPSVGYRISEPIHYHILKDKIEEKNYKSGNWLSVLKKLLSRGDLGATVEVPLCIGGSIIKQVCDLQEELVEVRPPQILTYITDCAPIKENIDKAINFAKNSTLLIIEAVFTDSDIEHALQKNHLTVGYSKHIFRESGSNYVRFTHFASRYEQDKANFMQFIYDGMDGKVHTKNS